MLSPWASDSNLIQLPADARKMKQYEKQRTKHTVRDANFTPVLSSSSSSLLSSPHSLLPFRSLSPSIIPLLPLHFLLPSYTSCMQVMRAKIMKCSVAPLHCTQRRQSTRLSCYFVHCLVLQAELEELGKAEDRSKVEKFLSTGTPSLTILASLTPLRWALMVATFDDS